MHFKYDTLPFLVVPQFFSQRSEVVSIHHYAPYTFRVIDIRDDDGNTPLHRQYAEDKSKLCDYCWSTARMPIYATTRARPLPSMRSN